MQRILVIEDDPFFMRKFLAQMQSIGYRVNVVFGGSLALEFFQKGFYDLVVIDTDLADKPGIEVIGQIRKASHDIPIFVLTHNQSRQNIIDAIESGAAEYYFKNDPHYFSKLTLSISQCKPKTFWPPALAARMKRILH